jgi:PA14 domain
MKRVARCVMVLGLCAWRPAPAQQEPVPTFGTTVVIPSGLRGEIYYIRSNSTRLPNFKKLKRPKGIVYTESLNVPPQHFLAGFPGVTKRYVWFAINYTGKFWIEKPGEYRFSLTSDDGAQLYIDDQLIIDNDGLHSPATQEGMATLAGGIHRLGVPYFQGPPTAVALVLKIAGPGEHLRVFSTEEFKPPPNPADWKFPEK